MTQHQRLLDPTPGDAPAASPIDQPLREAVALSDGKPSSQETNAWLDLLLPDQLPAETSLTTAERNRMHSVLRTLLEALELDHAASVRKLEDLLVELGKPDGLPAAVDTTGLPLTAFQASDYDRYFRVNRLTTAEPAVAMARSLIQTVHAVTGLFDRGKDLPTIHIRRQIEGFVSHTHLLARTFGVEPLR